MSAAFAAQLLPAGEVVKFSFRISTPRTQKELGWREQDKRPLGFRLTKLQLTPAGSMRYRLGDLIDFSEGGDSITFVGDALGLQWTAPDPFGTWTIGPEAGFKVSFQDAPAAGIPAAFVLTDCNVGGSAPSLSVQVKANGHPVGEWTLGPERESHKRLIQIPAAALAGSTDLNVVFEIPGVQPAVALGWTDDPRPLGLRLARAVFGADQIEIPALGPQPPAKRPMTRRILGLPFYAVHVARILTRMAIKKWSER